MAGPRRRRGPAPSAEIPPSACRAHQQCLRCCSFSWSHSWLSSFLIPQIFLDCETLPSDSHLTVPGVLFKVALARSTREGVHHAVRQLGDDRDVDLILELSEEHLWNSGEVALDVRDSRRLEVPAHALLTGDHRPLHHGWTDDEVAAEGPLDLVHR